VITPRVSVFSAYVASRRLNWLSGRLWPRRPVLLCGQFCSSSFPRIPSIPRLFSPALVAARPPSSADVRTHDSSAVAWSNEPKGNGDGMSCGRAVSEGRSTPGGMSRKANQSPCSFFSLFLLFARREAIFEHLLPPNHLHLNHFHPPTSFWLNSTHYSRGVCVHRRARKQLEKLEIQLA
jgi:hypothetical protein